jgi:hypothetical protein
MVTSHITRHMVLSSIRAILMVTALLLMSLTHAKAYEVKKPMNSADMRNMLARAASTSPTLENEHVSITIDSVGTFTMQRASDSKWLLYPISGTTQFSIKVDDNVYSSPPFLNSCLKSWVELHYMVW